MRGELIVQSGHYINITDAVFSPDGRRIATCSADESVRLWDVGAGCEAAAMRGHRGPVYHVAFDGSGTRLVSAGWDHDVRIWDVAGQVAERVLTGIERHPVDALALSASGTRVAATGVGVQDTPRQLLVWDTATGETLHALDVPGRVQGQSTALAFTDDGSLLAFADAGHRVQVLDVTSGAQRVVADTPAAVEEPDKDEDLRVVDALLFAGSRLVVVVSGSVAIVDPADGALVGELSPANRPHRAQLLSTGQVALFGADSVELWDLDGDAPAETIGASAVAVSPDGRLLAAIDGRHLVLVDRRSGRPMRRLGSRLHVPFQPGNRHRQFVAAASPTAPVVASAGPDGAVRLWDLARSPTPRVFQAHEGAVDDLAFDPSGRLLATAGGDGASVWRLDDLTCLSAPAPDDDAAVKAVAFSAEGSALVTGGWDGQIRISDVATGEQLATADLGTTVEALAVSPFNHVAAAAFAKLYVWEPFRQGDPAPNELGVMANAVAFDRSGRLAVGLGNAKWFGFAGAPGEGIVMLVDTRRGEPVIGRGHRAAVKAVAFSPDGDHLVSGSEDGFLLTWRPGEETPASAAAAHTGDVTAAAFTFDGRFAVTIGLDGAVRLWEPGGQLALTLLALDDDDFVAVTDDNHYAATKTGLGAVVLQVGEQLVAFEQFDLQLNRPDLVLARLGYAPPEVVAAFAEMHQRRLERLGVADGAPDATSPPVVTLLERPPAVCDEARLCIAVRARRDGAPLDRLMVYVNDVPASGRAGTPLDDSADEQTVGVDIDLATGDNDVQVWAVDRRGVQSIRDGFRVFSTRADPARSLYLLTVGVSRYRERRYDLEYAAKDARDLAAEISRLQRRFARVDAHVLEDATRADILSSRRFLQQGTVDDQVIMLFAGHGTLAGGDFVFLPADFDPADPAATGISYGELELLVDGIPPRRRLLLLDACHSGETDGTGPAPAPAALPAGVRSVRSFRDLRPAGAPPMAAGAVPAPQLVAPLQELFADLRQESGAYVLAASGAEEYAFELDDIQNGVFTASVIRALRGTADDGLTVSELARRVTDDVRALTMGGQRPVSRRENLADDFYVI